MQKALAPPWEIAPDKYLARGIAKGVVVGSRCQLGVTWWESWDYKYFPYLRSNTKVTLVLLETTFTHAPGRKEVKHSKKKYLFCKNFLL